MKYKIYLVLGLLLLSSSFISGKSEVVNIRPPIAIQPNFSSYNIVENIKQEQEFKFEKTSTHLNYTIKIEELETRIIQLESQINTSLKDENVTTIQEDVKEVSLFSRIFDKFRIYHFREVKQ